MVIFFLSNGSHYATSGLYNDGSLIAIACLYDAHSEFKNCFHSKTLKIVL